MTSLATSFGMARAGSLVTARLRGAPPAALAAVARAMGRIAPLELAEPWDNVGILLDAPTLRSFPNGAGGAGGSDDAKPSTDDDATRGSPTVVFLTNDLTEKVVAEALDRRASVVVTYHPTPFRKFNKLARDSPAGRVVLALASHGVAVYSPHTALDSAKGGVNDWLASGLGDGVIAPVTPDPTIEGAGKARTITFTGARTLADVVASAKAHLRLDHVRVAIAMHDTDASSVRATAETVGAAAAKVAVRSVAVCAGSGASVLSGVDVDCWLTGEASHHEVLAANAAGISVILTDHSNTERGYLPQLRDRLVTELALDAAASAEVPAGFDVVVTELDADPLVVL